MGRLVNVAGVLVVGTVLLAGCLGLPGDGGQAVDATAGATADAGNERGAAALLGADSPLPAAPPADGARTLDEVPTYRVGEWWTLEVEYRLSGNAATLTRVVAGTQGGDYLVGMPADGFQDEAIVEHLPPFGRVDRATLAFHAHDHRLDFVDHPLEEGKTWETQWWGGSPVDAEVARVDGDRAEVHLDRGSRTVRGIWDAQMGAFASFESPGHLAYEVVDHGYAYEGDLTVPADRDIVFCHGRSTAVVPIQACHRSPTSPAGPVETVNVSDTYDRVSYGILVYDAPSTDEVGTGAYRIEVTDPSGGAETVTKLPDEPGLVHAIGGEADPVGAWRVETQALGHGAALLEGVGYKVYEVELAGP